MSDPITQSDDGIWEPGVGEPPPEGIEPGNPHIIDGIAADHRPINLAADHLPAEFTADHRPHDLEAS